MTRGELYYAHVDKIDGSMDDHTKISIEYAISVLEEVADPDYQVISDGECGVISIPQDSIYGKIKELRKLIEL